MSSALVFGATGATGKHILSTVLGMKEYTKVGEFGRRVTPLESLTGDKGKLVQKVVEFDKISEEAELKQHHWDVVFIAQVTFGRRLDTWPNIIIALGRRAQMREAQKHSKESTESASSIYPGALTWLTKCRYVLAAAKAAKSTGTQRLVYISTGGANKNSSFLYMRSKGLTEEGLASLGYDTLIFRAGYLAGANRNRIAERIIRQVFSKPKRRQVSPHLSSPITGILKHISDSIEIQVSDLGRAAALAGYLGSDKLPKAANPSTVTFDGGKFTLIDNAGALRLAKVPLP
jgi:oxidoreductase